MKDNEYRKLNTEKFLKLYNILVTDFGLKTDWVDFSKLPSGSVRVLEFSNYSYLAYHICLRLCQLLDLPNASFSYKLIDKDGIHCLSDHASKRNYGTYHLGGIRKRIELKNFDEIIIDLYPENESQFHNKSRVSTKPFGKWQKQFGYLFLDK